MPEERSDTRTVAEPLHGASGRVTGGVALAVIVLVVVLGVSEPSLGVADWFYALLALVAVLTWAAMLRPGVLLEGDHVVLRNMYETVRVPLLAVRSVEVRSVLVVHTAAARFVSPAIGRSRRQMTGRRRPGAGGLTHILGKGQASQVPDDETTYSDFVEERIRARTSDLRAQAGLPVRQSDDDPAPPPTHRSPAWPEIAATALAVVALVVTVLV